MLPDKLQTEIDNLSPETQALFLAVVSFFEKKVTNNTLVISVFSVVLRIIFLFFSLLANILLQIEISEKRNGTNP